MRPEDDVVEEALEQVDRDDEAVATDDPSLPDEANEADVLEQREQVPEDEEEEYDLDG